MGAISRNRIFRQVPSSWGIPRLLPKARYWGVRLDTAAVSPTAVRERRTEYTGMMS